MGFFRETIVKRPRKPHWCHACGKAIQGEHLEVAGLWDGGVFGVRLHLQCHEEVKRMCAGCEYRGDCQGDMGECWRESKSRKAEEV